MRLRAGGKPANGYGKPNQPHLLDKRNFAPGFRDKCTLVDCPVYRYTCILCCTMLILTVCITIYWNNICMVIACSDCIYGDNTATTTFSPSLAPLRCCRCCRCSRWSLDPVGFCALEHRVSSIIRPHMHLPAGAVRHRPDQQRQRNSNKREHAQNINKTITNHISNTGDSKRSQQQEQ